MAPPAANTSTAPPAATSSQSSGLNVDAKIGIGVGVGVCGIGIILIIIFGCLRYQKTRRTETALQGSQQPAGELSGGQLAEISQLETKESPIELPTPMGDYLPIGMAL